MKIPFVLQAVFGMLLIANAPLNKCSRQEIRTESLRDNVL